MPDGSTTVTWRIHLAARRPWRTLVALLAVAGAAGFLRLLEVAWPWVAVWTLVLLASIAESLLPMEYTLDAEGAHVRQLWRRTLRWSAVRRVRLEPGFGVRLLTLPAAGWRDNFRGMLLRGDDLEAIMAEVGRLRTGKEG